MKKASLLFATLMLCSIAGAQELPNAPTPKNDPAPVQAPKPAIAPENRTGSYLFFYASAACGAGLAISDNRAKSAEIGIPVYLGLNLLAKKIHGNHPKLSYFLQVVSPAGCYAGLNKDRKRIVPTGGNSGGNEGGFPVTNPPSGGNPGNGGGVVPPGGGNNDPGTGGGSTPPVVPPVTPPVVPPVVPPTVPPPTNPCTVRGGTDCGIGNGGINNGNPSGPPFTPPGKGGNPGDGSKRP